MSPPERAFAFNEARRGFGGVLQALDCLWVNDPVHAAAAEYKPVQLAAAAACGLRVPDSIITNDPARAHAWAVAHGYPVIYKPLSGVWHPEDGAIKIVYTSRVDDLATLAEGGIEHTAHLFQQWIEKAYEARAVVVGGQVYTTAIHTESEAGRVDWRADYDSHRYQTVEPPPAVREALVRLHRRLGLTFGAVDLAITPDGEWVFFETNPAGQWAWLAEHGARPVASALADVLEKGRDHDRPLCG
jgi:glutathione synthase/RimK-type ligase-like ATP-grasp enzyme